MTKFILPETDGKPLAIVDFKLNLLSSPPEINERIIETIDPYVYNSSGCLHIDYKDAPTEEGRLNIYICRFRTGRYRLHIFGKIKGQEFKTEKEVSEATTNSLNLLNHKVKYVLTSSRNILKTYYMTANVKSLEAHLMAFLLPL